MVIRLVRKKRVTLQEIADALGLSQFSVSRALAGKPGISEATRELVTTTAEQMGYPARQREKARSVQDVVLFMLPDRMSSDGEFWPRVMLGAQRAVRSRGANLVMEIISGEEEASLCMPPNLERLVIDGVVCTGLSSGYVQMLQQKGHCVVILDRYIPDLGVDGVMADNLAGMRAVTAHLISVGHSEIGFVGNNGWAESYYHRWYGYRQAMEQHGLSVCKDWSILVDHPDKGPWELGFLRKRLQGLQPIPSAWVCVNDSTALNLIVVLGEMGLRVPEDVSVVGFDDLDRAAQSAPALTTVRCFREAMGARAVERLYRRLESPDDPADLLLVGTELRIRQSTQQLDRWSRRV